MALNGNYLLAKKFEISGKFNLMEEYMLKAANEGYVVAMVELAKYYLKKEDERATKLLIMGIVSGNVESMILLGNKYRLIRFYKEAEKYFLKAINKKNLTAMNLLAIMYEAKGDLENASNLYFEAVLEGDSFAAHNLGGLHFKNKEFSLSEIYYEMSKKRGVEKEPNTSERIFSGEYSLSTFLNKSL